MFDSTTYPNSRSLQTQQSRMGSNLVMPSRKLSPNLLLGSYVGSCVGRQALNGLCRYPEMVDLHVENLASALLSLNLQDIQDRLDEKLRSFANGEIPHAAHAVSALYSILVCYRTSGIPPATDNPGTRAKSKCTWAEGGNCGTPPHRKPMYIALIQSMHCQGHSSLDAPSELNPPQRIPSPLLSHY